MGERIQGYFVTFLLFLIFIYGIFALSSHLGIVESSIFYSSTILELLLICGAVFYFRRLGQLSGQDKTLTLAVGLCFLFFGALPLLIRVGISKILPVFLRFSVSPFVITVVFLVSSAYVFLDQVFTLASKDYS